MIRVSFSNLAEIKSVYDPAIVKKATESATRKLRDRASREVSKAVRKRYAVRAGEISSALDRRTRYRNGASEGLLIYTSSRLSLSRFATGKGKPTRSNRPKVRTRRGVRYGAKVRLIKGRPAKLINGPVFWGRARAGQGDEGLGQGAWQIWKREGLGRDNIRRLTGPSISHMTRGYAVQNAVEAFITKDADRILAERLNFYTGRKAGVL